MRPSLALRILVVAVVGASVSVLAAKAVGLTGDAYGVAVIGVALLVAFIGLPGELTGRTPPPLRRD